MSLFSIMENMPSIMSVLNRLPDRRSSKRDINPNGRRSCERFVICDSLDAVVRTNLGISAGVDVLDISSSGMFAISCSNSFRPSIGENLQITFFQEDTSKSVVFTGSVRYISIEERDLIDYIGFGVEFTDLLGLNLQKVKDIAISFFGKKYIIAGKENFITC